MAERIEEALQIERVLVNLLRNGLEAMREAGLIEGALHVSTRIMDGADSNMVQTTVCNSGKLLDENTLKRIFLSPTLCRLICLIVWSALINRKFTSRRFSTVY